MISLDDGYSKKMVLEHLLSCIETDIKNLLINGLTQEALEAIRNRPARDLMRVAEMPQLEVKVHISSSAILSCFQRLDSMKRQHELKEYFVQHGATPDMLASLFKIPPTEVRAMRAALCVQSFTAGRPSMPGVEKRAEIQNRWVEITKQEPDIREQFYLLHRHGPSFPMSSLWATICEFKRTAYKPEQSKSAASCGNVTSPTLLS